MVVAITALVVAAIAVAARAVIVRYRWTVARRPPPRSPSLLTNPRAPRYPKETRTR